MSGATSADIGAVIAKYGMEDTRHFYFYFEGIEAIITKYDYDKTKLIAMLLEIQESYKYLPKEALVYLSDRMDIPLSRIHSVATFYSAFSLKPRGKNVITVCMGTACHVKGASRIVDTLFEELNIRPGETTEGMEFTLETANCLGACALGPVVQINDDYHGNVTPAKVCSILKKYRDEEDEENAETKGS